MKKNEKIKKNGGSFFIFAIFYLINLTLINIYFKMYYVSL